MVLSEAKAAEGSLVASLRSELAECKRQLSESRHKTRRYASRIKQLGSARAVSEKQLTELVRRLLELEGRLKREQTDITSALAKRDEIIARQQAEIELLQSRMHDGPVATTATNDKEQIASPILLTIDSLLERGCNGSVEDGEKHDSGRESDDDAISLKAVESQTKENEDAAEDSADSANHSESESPPPPPVNGCCYEKFLEATGLSQKAILTPSRQFQLATNNHRTVVKPKDVKHKDKDRHIASSIRKQQLAFCFSNLSVKENKRYWMEPYV